MKVSVMRPIMDMAIGQETLPRPSMHQTLQTEPMARLEICCLGRRRGDISSVLAATRTYQGDMTETTGDIRQAKAQTNYADRDRAISAFLSGDITGAQKFGDVQGDINDGNTSEDWSTITGCITRPMTTMAAAAYHAHVGD
jgi:hypothetical protein